MPWIEVLTGLPIQAEPDAGSTHGYSRRSAW